jgi:hypothetical protein
MVKIYCVDTTKKVTPILVRDAIIRCFKEAHTEVLKKMNENNEFKSVGERESFEKIQVNLIVRSVFDNVGEDFENPTKTGIVKVLGGLAEFAAKFRKPEIIKKHYGEIMKLVEKLE